MAAIPPILQPLLQIIKELGNALNDTRGQLMLDPIDVDQIIESVYGQGAKVNIESRPIGKSTQEPTDKKISKDPEPKEPAEKGTLKDPEPPKEPKGPAITPDGKYKTKFVNFKNGKACFDPEKFSSMGIFEITIANGKATFKVKDLLSDAEREDWRTCGTEDICEGDFDPMNSDAPITDEPGKAEFVDGLWMVTSPAILS